MARKLSRRSQQRIKKNLALLEEINTLADSISEDQLTDLVRRDAIGIGSDGYPTNSMPEFSSGGGFGGSSTERAALDGLPGAKGAADDWERRDSKHKNADEVRLQLQIIERCLHDAKQSLKQAVNAMKYVGVKETEIRGRLASTPCSICKVQAAQKCAWCIECYDQWQAEGRPDRTLYAMWRRQDKNSEGVVLVPEMPRPTVKT